VLIPAPVESRFRYLGFKCLHFVLWSFYNTFILLWHWPLVSLVLRLESGRLLSCQHTSVFLRLHIVNCARKTVNPKMVKVAIRLIGLTLLASHAFAQGDNSRNPSDPTTKHTEYWEQKQYCHREYFDMTRQNMIDSQAAYVAFCPYLLS